MSDTVKPQAPSQANGIGSLSFAAAAVGVGNWALQTRYAVTVPPDVAGYIVVLLTGVAHGAQMAFLAWKDRAPRATKPT